MMIGNTGLYQLVSNLERAKKIEAMPEHIRIARKNETEIKYALSRDFKENQKMREQRAARV